MFVCVFVYTVYNKKWSILVFIYYITRFCLESVSPVTASCPSSLSLSVQHTDLCQYMDKHPGGLHPDNIRVSEILLTLFALFFKLLLGDFVMKWLWSNPGFSVFSCAVVTGNNTHTVLIFILHTNAKLQSDCLDLYNRLLCVR